MNKVPGYNVKSNSKSFSCRYSRQFYFNRLSNIQAAKTSNNKRQMKSKKATTKKKKKKKKAGKGGRCVWVCENETNHIYMNNQNPDFYISAVQAFISSELIHLSCFQSFDQRKVLYWTKMCFHCVESSQTCHLSLARTHTLINQSCTLLLSLAKQMSAHVIVPDFMSESRPDITKHGRNRLHLLYWNACN